MVYAITPSGARAAADYALLHGEVSAMERALVEERSALDQLYVKEGYVRNSRVCPTCAPY